MRPTNRIAWFILIAAWTLTGWLSASTSVADESAKALDKAEQAANLIVKVTGENTCGSGIVFGRNDDFLFIATANHVVRMGASVIQNLRVEFKFWHGDVSAELLKECDKDLDLAVMRVNLRESDIPNDLLDKSVPLDGLYYVSELKWVKKLCAVGHPPGCDWYAPKIPCDVREIEGEKIRFDFNCAQGFSGGGVFDDSWRLVGMVRRFNDPICEAVSFERIRATLEKWRFEVSLHPFEPVLPKEPKPPTAKVIPGIIAFAPYLNGELQFGGSINAEIFCPKISKFVSGLRPTFEIGTVSWKDDTTYYTLPGKEERTIEQNNDFYFVSAGLKKYFKSSQYLQPYVGGVIGYSKEIESDGVEDWFYNLVGGIEICSWKIKTAVEVRYVTYEVSEKKIQFNAFGDAGVSRESNRYGGISLGVLISVALW